MVNRVLGGLFGVCTVLALGMGATSAQAVVGEPTNAAKTFSTNCAMCHNSPRGLAKGGNVQGFLIQHYTTGPQMSAAMAAYLAAAGAAPAGREKEKGQREAVQRDGAREAAPRESARERDTRDRDTRDRDARESRAAQPEEGSEKAAPKRNERKQQSAKATQEAPKRRHHDSAPAIDTIRVTILEGESVCGMM